MDVKSLYQGAMLLSSAVRGIFVATGHVRLFQIGDLYRCPVASGVAVLQQRLYSLRFDSLYIGERTRCDCGGLINGLFTVAYGGTVIFIVTLVTCTVHYSSFGQAYS